MRDNLGGMARINQWFVWFLQWDQAKQKYKKVPYSPDGMAAINHLDRSNWLTYDQATAAVAQLRSVTPGNSGINWALGFLFTKDCGYWFLDADDSIVNGGFANEIHPWLMENLPGAAFEYSSSSRGYHMFGRGTLPPHACKVPSAITSGDPRLKGLELYTADRGVAFGLSGEMMGNADTDHTAFMSGTLIPSVFPKAFEEEGGLRAEDFRDAPQDTRWIGPEDDDDLIRRAMASLNVADKMGHGDGAFAALWNNDRDALQRRYSGESEMDMALIAQLAFWTGKNPARIERLMLRSQLVRDKWKERRGQLTWIQYSILEQLKKPMNVLQDTRVETPGSGEEDSGKTFLGRDDQAIWFKDCVYVLDDDAIYTPIRDGVSMLLNKTRFSAMRAGKTFILDQDNVSVTKDPWRAFLESQVFAAPRVDTTTFRPDMSPGAVFTDHVSKQTSVNLWQPPHIERKPGDVSWFLALVTRILPDERDQRILLSYMASMVRNPGIKFRWCPVLQGTKGNGKSSVADVVAAAIGRHYVTYPTTKQLTGKFNDWQLNRLLAVVNDVSVDPRFGGQIMEQLRPMISDDFANVEGKGAKITTRRICTNYFMTMNRQDGIRRDDDERRFAIFFTAQQSEKDVARDFPGDFFINFNNWLRYEDGYAKCADYLYNYPIDPQFDPAGRATRAPTTSSEIAVKAANVSPVTQIVEESIAAGVPGFMNGWVSLSACKDMLRDEGHRVTIHDIKEVLYRMGYIAHPGLQQDSRLSVPSMAEGNKRVVVWVTADHYSLGHVQEGMAYISKLYISDNSPNLPGTLI